jgi:CBS domain-containing protein
MVSPASQEEDPMHASDIMTRTLVTVGPRSTLSEAITKMVEARVSGLPVVDLAGRLVGVLTEGDLLRRAELSTEKQRSKWQQFLRGPARNAAEYVATHSHHVDDVMTTDIASVSEIDGIDQVVALMEQRGIRRVPVLRGDVVVGIISRADLIRVIGEALGARADARKDDPAIREALLGELKKQNWFGAQSVSIVVENGTVTLDGVLFDDAARAALVVAAENVPGVKKVIDRTSFVEPVPFAG